MYCFRTQVLSLAVFVSQAFAQNPVRYGWAVDSQEAVYRFAGQWTAVPGTLVYVSTALDNTTWGVNRSNNVFRWNGSAWTPMPGQLAKISVGSEKEIWGVTSSNAVLKWNSITNNWTPMPGPMQNVSVAADGAVWSIDPDDNVHLWTGWKWQKMPGKLRQISAGTSQNVWGVNGANQVFRLSTNGDNVWEMKTGTLKQVTVSSDGEVWGINTSDDLVRWNGASWDTLGKKAAHVSVGQGVTGAHVFYGNRAWRTAVIDRGSFAGLPLSDQCPTGWRLPTKSDLDAVVQHAGTQPDPKASLTSATGFAAATEHVYVSSTKRYPAVTDWQDNNYWKFWSLFIDKVTVAPLNVGRTSRGDADDGTLEATRFFERCVQAVPSAVQSDTGGCSAQFGAAPDLRSASFASLRVTTIPRVLDGFRDFASVPVAPITPKPQGGAYINYLSSAKRSMLLEIDAQGNPVGQDKDLGAASAVGAVGADGGSYAYLLRNGHKLEFRVSGGATTVIMDNDVREGQPTLFSGRGVKWTGANGDVLSGSEAMRNPLDWHRAVVLSAGGKWFTIFDHANNFNAYTNPQSADEHQGNTLLSFKADGSEAKPVQVWGTSHSIDTRMIADGNRIVEVTLGDAFPMSLNARIIDVATGGVAIRTDLLAGAKFPDTQIGTNQDGTPVYGIAGDKRTTSAGILGELLQVGCGQYALTYAIRPGTFTSDVVRTSTVNETGLLILDQDLNIIHRAVLRKGDDVEFLKTARYGKSALLVAWKTRSSAEYWATIVDVRGVTLQPAEKLPAGATFTASDGFVTMANGDVVWTVREGTSLKLVRLPQPNAQEPAPQPNSPDVSVIYRLNPQHATSMCLDVFDAGNSPGSKVNLWGCHGGANQGFYFTGPGNGIFEIQPSYNRALCLDVVGAETSAGTKVALWTCHGGTNQKWRLISAGADVYELEPQSVPGFRLDVFRAAATNGAEVVVWPATGGSNQKWVLVR